jgi:single-stranded-DNA-specific exonuclease
VETRWILAPVDGGELESFWKDVCSSKCISELLRRKGFSCAEAVDGFLRPRLATLADPFLLPQMAAAVERIFAAIDKGERIVLFGDYDVDGVTSLALLATMLRAYGTLPELFLPLRMEEGYGLSPESVARCCEMHRPQLLIAVDCGTSSSADVNDLSSRGADVIILDHHEPKSALPDCVAVVNPKTTDDCDFKYLCSVGIVFKLCHALLKRRPLVGFDLKKQLDLVALGTVADIVPLDRENRLLVQRGARQLAESYRPGVRKLMQVSAVRPPIAAEHIGFRLGPRLNAAGRLSTAEKALKLLLTTDEDEADQLATALDVQNRERQTVEKNIFAAALERLETEFDSAKDAAIVVGAPSWHPGVLGIVASRLTRRFHRPSIVVGFGEDGVGKGSGRSIEGLSLVEALTRCAEWLQKYGGHEMAAGLVVNESDFAAFRGAFLAAARDLLSDEQLQPRLHIDYELGFPELNADFLQWHEMLQPFGNGNPQPVFLARAIEPDIAPQVVKEKHLVLRLRQGNYRKRAVFFDAAENQLPEPPWDIAFRIGADEYNGETRLQMRVEAMRAAAST